MRQKEMMNDTEVLLLSVTLAAGALIWLGLAQGWAVIAAACLSGMAGVAAVCIAAAVLRRWWMYSARVILYSAPAEEIETAEQARVVRCTRRLRLICAGVYAVAATVLLMCMGVRWTLTLAVVGGVTLIGLLAAILGGRKKNTRFLRTTLTGFEYRTITHIRHDDTVEEENVQYWQLEGYGRWRPVEKLLYTRRGLWLEDFPRESRFVLLLRNGVIDCILAQEEFPRAWELAREPQKKSEQDG